jgi:membrane-associated protease RseP (regulator of RpoE activity)
VLVAAAGPSMNFLIAGVLMFTVLFFAGDYRHRTPTTTLAEVTQGAKDAGLRPGDDVVAIDGKAVQKWADIAPQIKAHKDGDTVHFVIRRGDQVLTVPVVVHASTADPSKRIVAGIAPTSYLPHPGLLTSIAKSPREVVAVATDSVKALGDVFSPSGIKNYFRILAGDKSRATDASKRFVSPVGFVRYSAQAVKAGWVDAVWLLLAINVFVGLFNLLPLLPFDGGHIAVATYERIASLIRRRRVQVDVAKLLPFTVAVVAVLGFIFVSAMFLDIAHPASNPF